MKTLKKSWIVLLVIIALLLIPGIVNAANVTRDVYSNNGSMKFNFSGLTLDTTHEYEFGLTQTAASPVETWHLITEYNESTATVDITTNTKDLRNAFNAADTGYISIKDKTADEVVVEPTAVDLKIPYLKVTNFVVVSNGKEFKNEDDKCIQVPIRCASNSTAYYQYEKITDTALIDKYKELKASNGDYLELESDIKQTVPTANWKIWDYWNGYDSFTGMNGVGYTQKTLTAPDTGLYYMWLYFAGNNVKNVYGVILVDNLNSTEPLGPSVPVPTSTESDFSNVKATLVREGVSGVCITLENFTVKRDEESLEDYYLCVSDSVTPPSITNNSEFDALGYAKTKIEDSRIENGKFTSYHYSLWDSLVEQDKDIYVHILRRYYDDDNNSWVYQILKTTDKLNKIESPKYADAFFATFSSKDRTQIITSFIHGDTDRKMQIKIGKITDTSILSKIKNNDISGFADLMSYAKKTSGIFDEIKDSTDNEENGSVNSFAIEYNTKTALPLEGKIENGAYYFLYVKTIDEDGKWAPNEAVTLATTTVTNDYWSLDFYDTDNFKWTNFKDPTVAPTKIPQTGQNIIVAIAIVSVVGLGVYTYRRLKNYRDVI